MLGLTRIRDLGYGCARPWWRGRLRGPACDPMPLFRRRRMVIEAIRYAGGASAAKLVEWGARLVFELTYEPLEEEKED